MAKSLDEEVAAFRARPLDGGPYPYLWLDALAVQRARAGPHRPLCLRGGQRGERRGLPRDPRAATSSRARTRPPGRCSCAILRPAASPACSSSSPTTTRASSPRSRPCSPEPAGSGAGRTSCATCSAACRRAPSPSWPPWCAPSSRSPPRRRSPPSSRRVVEQLAGALPRGGRHARGGRLPTMTAFAAFPVGALAADLVEQPAGAPQPRDPPAHATWSASSRTATP